MNSHPTDQQPPTGQLSVSSLAPTSYGVWDIHMEDAVTQLTICAFGWRLRTSAHYGARLLIKEIDTFTCRVGVPMKVSWATKTGRQELALGTVNAIELTDELFPELTINGSPVIVERSPGPMFTVRLANGSSLNDGCRNLSQLIFDAAGYQSLERLRATFPSDHRTTADSFRGMSKGERNLLHKVRERYPHAESQARPDWINPQHLDVFIKDINIALEYQGDQHRRPVKRFGGSLQFAKQQERDQRKRAACKAHGVELIEVYKEDNLTEIIARIARFESAARNSEAQGVSDGPPPTNRAARTASNHNECGEQTAVAGSAENAVDAGGRGRARDTERSGEGTAPACQGT